MILLLITLGVTTMLGVVWLATYWIDRAYWHMDNRLRTGDRYWRAWWRG